MKTIIFHSFQNITQLFGQKIWLMVLLDMNWYENGSMVFPVLENTMQTPRHPNYLPLKRDHIEHFDISFLICFCMLKLWLGKTNSVIYFSQ